MPSFLAEFVLSITKKWGLVAEYRVVLNKKPEDKNAPFKDRIGNDGRLKTGVGRPPL